MSWGLSLAGDIFSMHTFVIRSEDYGDLRADLRIHYEFIPAEPGDPRADVEFDRVQAKHPDGEFGTASTEQAAWAVAWVAANKQTLIEQALRDIETVADPKEKMLADQEA